MRVPPATIQWWASTGVTAANPDEVARAAAAIGPNVSQEYLSFLSEYGFVTWDMDVPDTFEFRMGGEGQTIVRRASVTHLWGLDHIERMAADVRDGGKDSLPLYYPNTHFPIGSTGGQAQILLELEPTPGRIWYWPERRDVWGEGDNTELGFVAQSFDAFVESLQLEE